VPVHEILARNPSPQFRHDVEAVRPLRDIVQRDMSGRKMTNARRDLPEYIREHLGADGKWTGPVWDITVWRPAKLELVSEDAPGFGHFKVNPTEPGFCLDGESRTLSMEKRFIDADTANERLAVLNIPLSVRIYDGIPVERA